MPRRFQRLTSARFLGSLALLSFSAAVASAWLAAWWPGFWLGAAGLGLAAAFLGVRALNAPIEIPPSRLPDPRPVGRRAITSAIVESHRDSRQRIESDWDSRRQAMSATVLPAPSHYPVLRPEEEEEIEAMFQRLKSAGSMDVRNESET